MSAARFARGLHVISFNHEDADERTRRCLLSQNVRRGWRPRHVRRPCASRLSRLAHASGNAGFRDACAGIKVALAPNGVIAPGRCGIGTP
jgi:4-cresol dehydrogenase (hydroxylating) flavoprotein subunit